MRARDLPGPRSARVQAMLALAAKRTGNSGWEQWLRRRAELLTDAADLVHNIEQFNDPRVVPRTTRRADHRNVGEFPQMEAREGIARRAGRLAGATE